MCFGLFLALRPLVPISIQPGEGTRQNRSVVHAKADMQPRCFWRQMLRSAVFSTISRKQARSKRPHSKTPLSAAPRCTECKKRRKISRLCLWNPFLRVYFYINLSSTLTCSIMIGCNRKHLHRVSLRSTVTTPSGRLVSPKPRLTIVGKIAL